MARSRKREFLLRGPGRRLPVPGFPGASQHIIQCRVEDLPEGIPKFNVRLQDDLDKVEYRNVKKHLLGKTGPPNMFYLMSQGIVMIVESVQKIDGDDCYKVSAPETLSDDERHDVPQFGIMDGAHLYDISIEGKSELPAVNAERESHGLVALDQWVEFRIYVGIPPELAEPIVTGRSTSVQVQSYALMDFRKYFDWMKERLAKASYVDNIGWTQGAGLEYDVREIVRILEMFNLDKYPVEAPGDVDQHPMRAYSNKGAVLTSYGKAMENQTNSYRSLAPVLPDLLTLTDLIHENGPQAWNDSGKKAASLPFVKTKEGKQYLFTGREGRYEVELGALCPILAAFRCHLMRGSDGQAKWRSNFKEVVKSWEELAVKLMNAMRLVYEQEVGRGANIDALGKCGLAWEKAYSIVYENCRKKYGL